MIDLKAIIKTVEGLLAQGTAQGATYAALECRLAIEKICYDRLKVAHDYISHDDLRRWQPRDVVETLIAEVDGHIASPFTLSMSREPAKSSSQAPAESPEWVQVGTQTGFDPKRLGSLWHSLSNVALHVRLPRTKSDHIPAYGDENEVREKVADALGELRRLAEGNLISSGVGKEVSFECECGQRNKRRAVLLKEGQTVSCVRADCPESYTVLFEGGEILFERRKLLFECKCGRTLAAQTRVVEQLKRDQAVMLECECGGKVTVMWRIKWHSSSPSDQDKTTTSSS